MYLRKKVRQISQEDDGRQWQIKETSDMEEAVSCGGVVIHRGKILLLYKQYKNRYEGWVLPKGTVEEGETFQETALREVREETGVSASIVKFVGTSEYTFTAPENLVHKSVHWYLMSAPSYYSRPQREEYFTDSGYYKYHEAKHLVKFSNERRILEDAYQMYRDLYHDHLWKEPGRDNRNGEKRGKDRRKNRY